MEPIFLAISTCVFASAAEVWSLVGEGRNREGRGNGMERGSGFQAASCSDARICGLVPVSCMWRYKIKGGFGCIPVLMFLFPNVPVRHPFTPSTSRIKGCWVQKKGGDRKITPAFSLPCFVFAFPSQLTSGSVLQVLTNAGLACRVGPGSALPRENRPFPSPVYAS